MSLEKNCLKSIQSITEIKELEEMKRYLFYCNNCGFEYSGADEEPCPCSLCGTINNCCSIEHIIEGLETEAKEYALNRIYPNFENQYIANYILREVAGAYFASAEPREKRIEELEQKNAELKDDNKVMSDNYSTMEKKFYDNLTRVNLLLEDVYKIAMGDWNDPEWHDQVLQKAREYFKEIKEND